MVAFPAGVKAVENIIVADGRNIPICHRDRNVKQPYGPKIIKVDDSSVLKKSGHSSHLGPVWSEGMVSGWGDIIPPFQYEEKGQTKIFTGLNWTDEGKAIW